MKMLLKPLAQHLSKNTFISPILQLASSTASTLKVKESILRTKWKGQKVCLAIDLLRSSCSHQEVSNAASLCGVCGDEFDEDEERAWIECDKCNQWYHCDCEDVTDSIVEDEFSSEFVCNECNRRAEAAKTNKAQKSNRKK